MLRELHGSYMTDAARINVAGLRESVIPRFVEALKHAAARGVRRQTLIRGRLSPRTGIARA